MTTEQLRQAISIRAGGRPVIETWERLAGFQHAECRRVKVGVVNAYGHTISQALDKLGMAERCSSKRKPQ